MREAASCNSAIAEPLTTGLSGSGQQLVQEFKLLRCKFRLHVIYAGDVAARLIERADEACSDRINAGAENDRYCCAGGLGRESRLIAAGRGNNGDTATNQVGGQFWQPIQCIVRPSVFDRDIPAFDVAGLGQTVSKRSQQRWCGFRTGIKKADHRYR